MIKNKNYIYLMIYIFLALFTCQNIYSQENNSYKTFITNGNVNYYLPNFTGGFALIDDSIIPQNAKIVCGKDGYLEIHSKTNLIRFLPSTEIEIRNNNIELLSGTIYINTIDSISLTINKTNFNIYKGIIVIQFSKEILINFISDAQIELNNQIFKPTKTKRIFKIINNNFQETKDKLSLERFSFFSREIINKINFINQLIDIFFERIFYLIDKNNSFIKVIEEFSSNKNEIEDNIILEIKKAEERNKNDIESLKDYALIYHKIQSNILDYNFLKFHYLEFYFQMRNYIEYYKKLISFANSIYDLNNFDEFPDYSSKSSFLIVYDKIRSFSDAVKTSYQLLEMSYLNILDSNSPVNKSFSKYELLKNQLKEQIEKIILESFINLPKDLRNIIASTFITQLECKASTTIYINKLYDILLILNNEYLEDQKIINKFFSLDDIVYKSLYLKQAEDINAELEKNFSTLNKNITILKYLTTNSNLIKDIKTLNFLNSIIEFYPYYNDDYLSVIYIIEEIKKSYSKYNQLLKLFIKKTDEKYYQNVLNLEIDKYLDYFRFIQNEITKIYNSEKKDIFFLVSLLDIQNKLISISYSLYDLLKSKFPSIYMPKKLYIEQQREYLNKLKEEISNITLEQSLKMKDEEIKSYLIIRIVVLNQIIEDIKSFRQSIKDYEIQKTNLQKSLLLFNLSINNKNSFDSENYKDNLSIIWNSEQLIGSFDQFFLKLDSFEKNINEFFDEIQNLY
ncbi:MAG: hypothetical protein ACK4YF_09005, partial [Exilispira sp.]